MGKLNYFNYCAMAVLLVLIATVLLRGMLNGRRNRCFWYVLLVALGSVICDIVAVELDNSYSTNVVLKYIAHSGYLILHNLSTPVYITYLIELTGTEYKIRQYPVQKFLLAAPFLSVLILTLLSPFTGGVFYLDENCNYTRGPWFVLLYISAVLYLLVGIFYVMSYRRLLQKWQFISSMGLLLTMPIAVAVQFIKPYVLVEMFSQALGVLFIMLVIQKPEERLDSVTGFNKYEAYTADMKQAFYNEKPIRIVMVHIVNYKWLNDLLGFVGINEMLKTAAACIRETCAEYAMDVEEYHLGRGLFCLTIEENSFSQTEKLAQAVYEALGSSMQIKHMDINLMTQVCTICCPEDLPDLSMLISFCNEFEWQKSVTGVFRASEMISQKDYELMYHMDSIIADAIVNRKFSVYYQPIYSVKEGRFNSAEALLRLKDEKHGFISPEIFIPVAERSGAIHRIGAYVLEEVCRFISDEEFAELGVDYIEVNLSTVQCMRGDLVEEVKNILEQYGVSAKQINLEITETAAAYAQTVMMENINELADAGIAISLDDYGTGYSNIQRVASMPFQIVKLDKAFTNLEENSKMEIVVRDTIRMIKDMNLRIVVEGIETAEMVKQFADLDCEYIQGFYYSKPLPREEFVEFIRRWKNQAKDEAELSGNG